MQIFPNMAEIKEQKIESLIPDDHNFNRGTEFGQHLIEKSLSEFGAGRGILLDRNGRIIAGNKTVENAANIGLEDVIIVPTDGTKIVATMRTDIDLDSEKGRAMALADNASSAANLKWDEAELKEAQEAWQIVPDDWGVNLDDEMAFNVEEDVSEDDFDENDDVDKRCVLGDIWQLGEHRLMCGDSCNIDDVDLLMGKSKADMVFTDPPYGYEYQSNKRTKTDKFDVIKNDDKILDFFPCAKTYCTGFVYVCASWKTIAEWINLFKKYFDLTNMIIWDRGGGGIGDLKRTFFTDYEIMLVSHGGQEFYGKREGSIWRVGKDDVNDYVHPTQKPIGISAKAIEKSTRKDDIVLDFFAGSGSTLMACEQLGRQCRTMELDPHYCDVILARWEKATGLKAIKLKNNHEVQ